jgi:hypothetical protein
VKVSFQNLDDLQQKLSSLDLVRLEKMLSGMVGISIEGTQNTKPGYESVYTVGSDGLPQLLKIPKSEPKAVALALFLAEPRHMLPEEISRVAGVKDPGRKYLSSGSYKKLFIKDKNGKYGLSIDGKKLVLDEIVPTLITEKKEG